MTASPFVGLRPFEREDAPFFFGREREAEILANLALTAPIVVVFAPSGAGKSSLLRAGMIPLLELAGDVATEAVTAWRSPLRLQVLTWCTDHGLELPADTELIDALGAMASHTGRRAILLLDQFEEISSAAGSDDSLWEELAPIGNDTGPDIAVVIAIREDYLGTLDPLMTRVPGLLEARFRLEQLGRTALERAVYEPLRAWNPPYTAEQDLVESVFMFLEEREKQRPGDHGLAAGYFQIVWEELWRREHRSPARRLTKQSFDAAGGGEEIVWKWARDTIDTSLNFDEQQVLFAVSRYMALPSGIKVSMAVDDLAAQLQLADFTRAAQGDDDLWRRLGNPTRLDVGDLVDGVYVESLLTKLSTSGAPLFRRSNDLGSIEFELTHDLLGPILREWRDDFASRDLEAALRALAEPLKSNQVTELLELLTLAREWMDKDERHQRYAVTLADRVALTAAVNGHEVLENQARELLAEMAAVTSGSAQARREARRLSVRTVRQGSADSGARRTVIRRPTRPIESR
jgi:hypothetical protein